MGALEHMDNDNDSAGAAILQGADSEIEAAIAADEAQWKAQGRSDTQGEAGNGPPRDDSGRFLPNRSASQDGEANDADRDGAEIGADGSDAVAGPTTNSDQQATQTGSQGKGAETPPDPGKAEGKPDNRSKFAKNAERLSRTWEGVNKEKAAIQAEREQFKLEREQFEAQTQAASVAARDTHGFTAADYERNSKLWQTAAANLTAQAIQAEAAGRLAEADELNAKAAEQQALAKAAQERAAGIKGGSGPKAVWERLAADLPEALQHNGPLNAELRAALRGNPQLMSDPMGPYRAAVMVGRKLLQATEAKLTAQTAEAAKVPGLLKQIAELSGKVKELQLATSIPGGGAAIHRSGSEGKRFEDMSLAEMEAELERGQVA
jgi:hypothetical protein